MFIFGLLFGSFFNVVALRVPKKEGIVKGSSHCPKCKRKLRWYELIPVLSFVFQLGKCRGCKDKISYVYPIFELITGICFAASYYIFGFNLELIYALIIVSGLIIIIDSDYHYMIIPDRIISLLFFGILIMGLIIFDLEEVGMKIVDAGALFLIVFLIKQAGNYAFKQESLGDGDIKLMTVVGFILGIPMSIIVIFLASFFALPVALYLLKSKKQKILPFGPFLAGVAILLFLLQIDIFQIFDYISL